MAAKGAQAFRTIREVADWLGVEAHVLRFWESKFPQIKPVKRAGGRRYYRPADMHLIGGIKVLLHDEGYTIRGVQRLMKEDGQEAVIAKAPPLDEGEGPVSDADAWAEDAAKDAAAARAEAAEADQADLPFDMPPEPDETAVDADEARADAAEMPDAAPEDAPPPEPAEPEQDVSDRADEPEPEPVSEPAPEPEPKPEPEPAAEPDAALDPTPASDAPAAPGDVLAALADRLSATPARPRNAAKKSIAALIEAMRKDPVS